MLEFPYYGYRKVTAHLQVKGIRVGRCWLTCLLRSLDLKAMQPKQEMEGRQTERSSSPSLSLGKSGHYRT